MTLLSDLARAKAAFQQRTLHTILTERPMTRHPLDGNAIAADAHYDRHEIGTEPGDTLQSCILNLARCCDRTSDLTDDFK